MKEYPAKRLIRDGRIVAEVSITLRQDDDAWGPTMSPEDAYKIDDVRQAMHEKDYIKAARLASLYTLAPVEHPENLGTDAA